MNKGLNLLVCTDFSSYSDDAAKAAEKIRKKCNGTAHILHVSEFSVMWDWMPPDYMEGRFELDLLNTLRKKIDQQRQETGLTAEGHVSVGLAPSIITQEAIDKKIDLIIIGHRGRTGKFHLGSMAEKIIASSPVPVLVVKGDFEVLKVAGLVDPNGLMENIIKWTENMSSLFKAKSEIISLFPDIASRYIGVGKLGVSTELLSLTDQQKKIITNNLKEKVRSKLISEETKIKLEFSTERKVAYHLNRMLDDEKVDLAIMQRHQSEFLEKILIGSETRRMLEIFEKNLLILPV